MQTCLLRGLSPVRRPAAILDFILLKDNKPSPIIVLAKPSLAKCLRFPLLSTIKEMLHFQSLPLCVSQSPQRGPTDREAPFPEPSFICFLESMVKKPPPLRFPNEAPMEIDAHLQSPPLHILQGPEYNGTPFRFPSQNSCRVT